jgi:uncharacterized lipoprotein YddW (UPF0748 family)/N-acetylmuramoyl-L-alanine amidase
MSKEILLLSTDIGKDNNLTEMEGGRHSPVRRDGLFCRGNMKFRSLRFAIVVVLVLSVILSGCSGISGIIGAIGNTGPEDEEEPVPVTTDPENTIPEPEPHDEEEFRGIWVSTVINLDYPSEPGIPVSELKEEALEILDNCALMGFTAVFLQVRPSGDALYKSELFPWSQYLTGEQGLAPEDDFDPLEFWVEQAHLRGLELHAWINPYRVARLTHDVNTLSPDNYAYLHPEWLVMHTDGHMYYNPGIPAVRTLIVDGIIEIVENYDVDGIHFDDYFYPDSKFDDDKEFEKFGGRLTDKGDWRRDNINKLIEETYTAIKSVDSSVRFGVSPFGIWANESENPLGSKTRGNQSYYSHYADTRRWVLESWVDYICPQIYWNIGYSIADYEVLLQWWADVVRNTSVDLYIGHASYRTGNPDPDSAWYGTAEIRRQLELNEKTPEVDGSVHFRYAFFITYPPLASFIIDYHHGPAEYVDYPILQLPEYEEALALGRPEKNITTTFDKMYLIGRCNPDLPLYLNGEEVTHITGDGYFGKMVKLDEGENSFEFVQGDVRITRIIHRSVPHGAEPLRKDTAEIIDGSTYPRDYDVYITPGEKITFRCTAPIGASVSVTLAGKSYKLYPSTTKSPGDDAIYYTRFSYTYTLPETDVTGRLVVYGTPVYKMTYEGVTQTVTANAGLVCVTPNAPYYARVTNDNAFIYAKSSTSGGPIGELKAGMVDYITAVTSAGDWVRLGMGGWVQRTDVDRFEASDSFSVELVDTQYDSSDKWDTLSFSVDGTPAAKVSLDNSTLTLVISNTENLLPIKLVSGGIISAYSSNIESGSAVYRLTVDKDIVLDGYYLDSDFSMTDSSEHTDNDPSAPRTLTLHLKRRPKVSGIVAKPLKGITVMVDAGHGNADVGALGPLGVDMAEKDITLLTAVKVKHELERLGAEVLMTRSGDEAVSLDERLSMSRNARPDLFLSIHNNAVEVNVDATSIMGISTWYMRSISKDVAEDIVNYISSDLGRVDRRANQASLYVCRGYWAPSVILETGFICNPTEYEWLTDDEAQNELARSIARALIHYFS